VAITKLEAEGFKSCFGHLPITWLADEYALGRFGEIAPFQPKVLEESHGHYHP
jgi:hypothetical protein